MNPVRDLILMFYTYVIKSRKTGRLYTGSTYEAFLNEEDVRSREKYLKSGMGKRYLKNRLKRFLSLTR